jgi:chloramphenicol-sensitive protein RarD
VTGAEASLENDRSRRIGLLFAVGAYLMWGLSGPYFVLLDWVRPDEIIAHRIIWTALLMSLALLLPGKFQTLREILSDRRKVAILALSSSTTVVTWYLFVWALLNGKALEASMGFFLLPLAMVLFGLMLGERMKLRQSLAVGLAALGVLYLIYARGAAPWLALGCAVSYGFYGLLRKKVPLDSLMALLIETAMLTPFALLYLYFVETRDGGSSFLHASLGGMALIATTAIFTAGTQGMFTAAARRVRLTTLGLLQYINPTCQMLVALFWFQEPFDDARMVTFLFIWAGLLLYSCDVPALVGWVQTRFSRGNDAPPLARSDNP